MMIQVLHIVISLLNYVPYNQALPEGSSDLVFNLSDTEKSHILIRIIDLFIIKKKG